jgi:high affinity Mn2+ porin
VIVRVARFVWQGARWRLAIVALLTGVAGRASADDEGPGPARLAVTPQTASDVSPLSGVPMHRWTGLHLGGHLAGDLGSTQSVLFLPQATGLNSSLRSVFGGVQIGYDLVLPGRVLVGVEGDISFPYFADDGGVLSGADAQRSFRQKVDFLSTVRGRLGYAFDRWLLYGTGGLAWAQARSSTAADATGRSSDALNWPIGWTAGAGAELALSPSWTLKGEYLFEYTSDANGPFASGAGNPSLSTSIHGIRLGLNWHFDGTGQSPLTSPMAGTAVWPLRREDWNIHWQSTIIEQGYFRFRSPYEGPNSLSGDTQFSNTVSATAFVGLRLWNGAEFYFNPEIDQGHGLSQTFGVAAFPNGEAQKAAYDVPRLNIDRAVVRQTIGMGGEEETIEDGPNRLRGKRDVARVIVTAGRFSVGDAFNLNSHAFDPRTQFLNWNIYGGGSYDWTMDKPGFTWGAVAELNQKAWAVRIGYFLEPTESDGNSFDINIPTHGQYLVEPEWRYSLFSQPGTLRLLAWVTRANMGGYEDALATATATSSSPNLADTRRVRSTYGFVANAEQALSQDVGLFSRASWTPGLVEVMGWTDCDESLSLGTSLAGSAWRRTEDRVGVAGVVEGLSSEARAYFAAGGMGILIGDTKLNYRPEQVLETYYAANLAAGATLTLDFQVVANPAYNSDRGPVPIVAARLHVER